MSSPANHARGNASISPKTVSRRRFLRATTTALPFVVVARDALGGPGRVSPNEKTTLAAIGTGGQGMQNLIAFLGFEEIQVTAVCDVNRGSEDYLSWNWARGRDTRRAGREPAREAVDEHYRQRRASGSWRSCQTYADYRELLEQEDVDAVMIATPDHTHAVVSTAALAKRKHVYCEKPLTYSVREAREVAQAARRVGVATQLGNQGQASEEARLTREWIMEGVIGPIHEVKVWSPARFWHWPACSGRPTDQPPVPPGLDWDLWLGPAPERPYHPEYHPWTWRNWWDFGTGLLGDLGCHKLSTVFKALDLGHPLTIDASSTKLNSETYPLGVLARYQFPARGEHPPLRLTWYDGGLKPSRPQELPPGEGLRDTIYCGEKGILMGQRVLPDALADDRPRPAKKLPRSPGHYHEWVRACRGGPPAGSNFVDHAGLLTEVCLLGNVAVRSSGTLAWDPKAFRITNSSGANRLLHREYREGWRLEGGGASSGSL